MEAQTAQVRMPATNSSKRSLRHGIAIGLMAGASLLFLKFCGPKTNVMTEGLLTCTTTADCKDERLPVCNTETKKCEPKPCDPPIVQVACPEGESCQAIPIPDQDLKSSLCGNGKTDKGVYFKKGKLPGEKIPVHVDECREFLVDKVTGAKVPNPYYCPDDCKKPKKVKKATGPIVCPPLPDDVAASLQRTINGWTSGNRLDIRAATSCINDSGIEVRFRVNIDEVSKPKTTSVIAVCEVTGKSADISGRLELPATPVPGVRNCFTDQFHSAIARERPAGGETPRRR